MRPGSLEAEPGMGILFKEGIERVLSGRTCRKGRKQDRVEEEVRKDDVGALESNFSLISWGALECDQHHAFVPP